MNKCSHDWKQTERKESSLGDLTIHYTCENAMRKQKKLGTTEDIEGR